MPTIWFARDGARPHTQSGNGITVTTAEAEEILSNQEVNYLGTEAPNIRPSTTSKYATNVVIQLEADEPTSKLLPQAGFYLAPNLTPEHVEQAIINLRKSG